MLQREGRCNRSVTYRSVDKRLTFLVTVNLKKVTTVEDYDTDSSLWSGSACHRATERSAKGRVLRTLSTSPVCAPQPEAVCAHFSEKSASSEGSSWSSKGLLHNICGVFLKKRPSIYLLINVQKSIIPPIIM